MGICVLNHFDEILRKRKEIYNLYEDNLNNILVFPKKPENFVDNYIYFPVLFKDEKQLIKVFSELEKVNVYTRRYFYPALNDINIYKKYGETKIAHDISLRIACLPLDTYLERKDVELICETIKRALK